MFCFSVDANKNYSFAYNEKGKKNIHISVYACFRGAILRRAKGIFHV
jgi:hypothetical protein